MDDTWVVVFIADMGCLNRFLQKESFGVNQSAVTMSTGELACTYASLLLHDDGIAITSEKIATLVKAAGVSVESYWPSLFAKLAEKRSIEDLILNAGSGAAAAAAPVAVSAPAGGAGGAVAAAAPAVEEKKEEVQEESDDGDLGFGLFD
ncbi:hypothetical protein SO802_024586 [Lithocarpus litseifolius]|uniref:60S acidic ribosomal protein P1 n=1 Tax=Lithocarpus litseifolius TaxID=425828 RepID=A0AAW2C9Z4_9ROSI